jgi:hypothetical protein
MKIAVLVTVPGLDDDTAVRGFVQTFSGILRV